MNLGKIHGENTLIGMIADEEGDDVYEELNELSDPDLDTLYHQIDQILDVIDEIHEDRARLQGKKVNS